MASENATIQGFGVYASASDRSQREPQNRRVRGQYKQASDVEGITSFLGDLVDTRRIAASAAVTSSASIG
jgi:hypothetical protein